MKWKDLVGYTKENYVTLKVDMCEKRMNDLFNRK